MTSMSSQKNAKIERLISSLKYFVIQIGLDILFSIFAGYIIIIYAAIIIDEKFDIALLYGAPLVYMIPIYIRYVKILEIIPRVLLYYLLCGDNDYKLWMSLIIGASSYVWTIFLLQWYYDWDQGFWYFPFYDTEGMSIYTACMVISTLVSPFVINYLKQRKARR